MPSIKRLQLNSLQNKVEKGRVKEFTVFLPSAHIHLHCNVHYKALHITVSKTKFIS